MKLLHAEEGNGPSPTYRGLPTWRCWVHDLKPSHPQKVKPARFIVTHPRPGVNYICMISTKYPCIQEMVQIWRIGCTIDLVRKEHDIATRCPWVNYVSPPPNVVCGEVETDELVVVYEVLIQQHEVSSIAVKMMGAFDCSNAWLIRTWSGRDLASWRSAAQTWGSKCSLNFEKKFCSQCISKQDGKLRTWLSPWSGVTLVLLQKGRYVNRASLWLPYIVLHPRIIDKRFWDRRAMESLANHVDAALLLFNPW